MSISSVLCVATRLRRCCTDSHRPAVLWSNYLATLACVTDTILTPQYPGVRQLTQRNQRDSRSTLRSCSEKQKSKLALRRQACFQLNIYSETQEVTCPHPVARAGATA